MFSQQKKNIILRKIQDLQWAKTQSHKETKSPRETSKSTIMLYVMWPFKTLMRMCYNFWRALIEYYNCGFYVI